MRSATQVCLVTTLNIVYKCLLSQLPAFSGPDNENSQETAISPQPNKVARQSLYVNDPKSTMLMLGLCQKRTLASQTMLPIFPLCMDIIPLINITSWIITMLAGNQQIYTKIA